MVRERERGGVGCNGVEGEGGGVRRGEAGEVGGGGGVG